MSIFDRIKNAIFGEAHATEASTATSVSSAAPTATPSLDATQAATPAPANAAQGSAAPPPTAPAAASVDVAPILDAAVKKSGQKLDWKHSIVDLMKALGMDATLEERKELAAELDYQGDLHDSVKMNTFLHKALLQKLAQNGGKVPAELLN